MNTIATSASTNTILAIDLGKYKSVACVHDQAAGEIAFTTFETTRHELQMLLARWQPAAVIIEACLLAGWITREDAEQVGHRQTGQSHSPPRTC